MKQTLTTFWPAVLEYSLNTRADFHHFSTAVPSNITGNTDRWLKLTTTITNRVLYNRATKV